MSEKPTLPTPDRLLRGVLALQARVHLDLESSSASAPTAPETIVEHYLTVLGDLFPGRWIGVRLLGGRSLTTPGASVLPQALVPPLEIKPRALAKSGLHRAALDAGLARATAAPAPVFAGNGRGFTVPLVAQGELLGALDVGYPGGGEEIADADELLLIPIANGLSVALRNLRLHAEAAGLRDLLGQLLEHADALIACAKPDLHLTVVSRALGELLGHPAAQLVGRDLRDLVVPGSRAVLSAVVNDALAGQPVRGVELELLGRGATTLTLWNVGAGGKLVVLVGQDLTRLHVLERQVLHAERLATIGQLASGVAHELNNPLTSILVYAEHLLQRSPDAATAERLRRILDGAERIKSLSRGLVQYARPSAAPPELVPPGELVRQALVFCDHVVKDRAELVVEIDPEVPPVLVVRGQLEQVLINLITNAVHALPASGGRLRLATRLRTPRRLEILVEDNGCGIPSDVLPRVFEAFFSTKGDGQGSGLGLSIVQNIVRAHHGEVEVESEIGKGSRFSIILPV